MKLLYGIALVAICGYANAQNMSILGIDLEKPIPLHECAIRFHDYISPFDPRGGLNLPCWKHDLLGPKPGSPLNQNESILLVFRSDSVPDGIDWQEGMALIVDGKVEMVSLKTKGVLVQESVISSLKIRFGEPIEQTVEEKQNGFGATFKVKRARWKQGEMNVIFLGAVSRTNEGAVSAATQRGIDAAKRMTRPNPSF